MERRIGTQGCSTAFGQGTALLGALTVTWMWATTSTPVHWRTEWMAETGIGFGIFLDDLSLFFALIVTGMSVLSLHYGARSLAYEEALSSGPLNASLFCFSMLFFTAAMIGMLCAENLIQLYICWELTDIASFLLIGLDRQNVQAGDAAVKTFIITASGGLALLAGFLLLGRIGGTYSIPELLAQGSTLHDTPVLSLSIALIVIGAASKSAQVPFHVWLPSAMIAPIAVNAFLDSAALLAAGVYLLARLQPLLADTWIWSWMVGGIGTASMVIGGYLAMTAKEAKLLLAYSTVSQYGFMFALLAVGSARALMAALFFWLHHSIIKAGLFFSLGSVLYRGASHSDLHEKQETRSSKLLDTIMLARSEGGSSLLWLGVAATLALSLGGVLPLAGFWMKELFLNTAMEQGTLWLAAVGLTAGAATIAYMLRFLADHFVGRPRALFPDGTVSASLYVAPACLAFLTVLFGVWPGPVMESLTVPAVSAVTGAMPGPDMTIHLNKTLVLSLAALTTGLLAFVARRSWLPLVEETIGERPWFELAYEWTAIVIGRLGDKVRGLQNGRLTRYIAAAVMGGAVIMSLSLGRSFARMPDAWHVDVLSPMGTVEWIRGLFLALIVVGTIFTVTLRRHLHVILALGAVGYLIGGLFAWDLGPNIGLVQVHVETFVTVLLLLGLVLITREVRERQVGKAGERVTAGRIITASLAGLGSAWLVFVTLSDRSTFSMTPWFVDHAETQLEANDVVAAILMHFRALDTLGEILVFAAATGGVAVLVSLITRRTTA